MVDLIQPKQLLIGDFQCEVWDERGAALIPATTQMFVAASNRESGSLNGIQFSGKAISGVRSYLTAESGSQGKPVPRRFKVTDKHGLSRQAYNLQVEIDLGDEPLAMGLSGEALPECYAHEKHAETTVLKQGKPAAPASATDLIDDLSTVLKKRLVKVKMKD